MYQCSEFTEAEGEGPAQNFGAEGRHKGAWGHACTRLRAGKQFWSCFFHVCPTKGAPHVRS